LTLFYRVTGVLLTVFVSCLRIIRRVLNKRLKTSDQLNNVNSPLNKGTSMSLLQVSQPNNKNELQWQQNNDAQAQIAPSTITTEE